MTGARGASLDVPHGLAENPPCSACVSRSLAQVEPWDEILPLAQSRGGTPIGERALQSARRTQVRWIRTRVDRRSASFFLSFVQSMTRKNGYRFSDKGHAPLKTWLKAQIVRLPATTAGILWRRSVRRAEKFLPLEQQLGCGPHREKDEARHRRA